MHQRRILVGKLVSKDILHTRPPSMQVKPIAGWTWYCSYHDTYGTGDDYQEVCYMAGAHMTYFSEVGDFCDFYCKEHKVKEEA